MSTLMFNWLYLKLVFSSGFIIDGLGEILFQEGDSKFLMHLKLVMLHRIPTTQLMQTFLM